LMWKYYTLLTDVGPTELLQLRNAVSAGAVHPKQAKVDLAKRIVADFHDPADADRAAEEFERRFGRKELPDDLPVIELTDSEWHVPLERMLVRCGLAESMSDARRKLEQGGVRIDGHKIGTGNLASDFKRDVREFTLQVGKRSAVRVKRK
jgi:tyrosyl-tRNA synthetase